MMMICNFILEFNTCPRNIPKYKWFFGLKSSDMQQQFPRRDSPVGYRDEIEQKQQQERDGRRVRQTYG
jgi:hypothetical protein